MLYMSSAPVQFKTKNVLHLVHPKFEKDPFVQQAITAISCEARQVARVGEHILTDQRYHSFQTVILHATPFPEWHDMLRRLVQGNYISRLESTRNNKTKMLLVYGTSVQMLPKTVLLIPKQSQKFPVDNSTKGLGLIDFQIDINFDPRIKDPSYLRYLQLFSQKFPIYLLDGAVLYSDTDKARGGSVYLMNKGDLTKVKQLPDRMTTQDQEAVTKRKIPPMRLLYAPETDTEEKEANAGASQTTTKEQSKV